MFNRILVPLDGSLLSEQALGPAAAIARASDAEIDVTFVHQRLTFGGFTDAPWNAELWNEQHRYVESIAHELVSGAGVKATHAIVTGEPAEMICERAHGEDVDLIVMTSHGRTGLSRVWMGSVTDEVVRHATVPVLVVRPIDSKKRLREAHHLATRILVPLDGSEFSMSILPAAEGFAKATGASLTLLRIVEPVPLITPNTGIPYAYMPSLRDDEATLRVVEEVKRQTVQLGEQLRRERGLTVTVDVMVAESVAGAIIERAEQEESQLIAMSTRGRGLSRLFVGSVADKVLRSSGLPMLVVRPATAEELSEQYPDIEAALAR